MTLKRWRSDISSVSVSASSYMYASNSQLNTLFNILPLELKIIINIWMATIFWDSLMDPSHLRPWHFILMSAYIQQILSRFVNSFWGHAEGRSGASRNVNTIGRFFFTRGIEDTIRVMAGKIARPLYYIYNVVFTSCSRWWPYFFNRIRRI